MSEIIRNEDTCSVKHLATGRAVTAQILDFKYQKNLLVSLDKSVKMSMIWNGKMYEGKMAGLDFVSDGPKISKTQTGIRG